MRTLTRIPMHFFRSARYLGSASGTITNRMIMDAQLSTTNGDLEKAESLYWSVLKHNPKEKLAYNGIFNLWLKKGSALGLHQSKKMNALRSMYQQNILSDTDHSVTPQSTKLVS